MKQEIFDNLLRERLANIQYSLAVKAKQYVRNGDCLHNFTIGEKMEGKDPTEILQGFLLKHLICYKDMLEDIKQGRPIDKDFVKELFGDIINFYILQEIQITGMLDTKPTLVPQKPFDYFSTVNTTSNVYTDLETVGLHKNLTYKSAPITNTK